jgi:hypothetical protein
MKLQTWKWNVKIRRWFGERPYFAIQRICGRLTGHQWKDSEWGCYCDPDGVPGVDVWCRWCNHFATITLGEAERLFPEMREIIQVFAGQDPRPKLSVVGVNNVETATSTVPPPGTMQEM